MEIIELKENNPIEIIEAFKNVEVIESGIKHSIKERVINSKVITDGRVVVASNKVIQNSNEYKIGSNIYDIDFLEIQKLYLKDYNYIITYLISCEQQSIQDILIHLNDIHNTQSLKMAKKVIDSIKNHESDLNFGNLYASLTDDFSNNSLEMHNKNVYIFKKNH